MNVSRLLIISIIVGAAAGLLYAQSNSVRDEGRVEVVHVDVTVRSPGDAALAALAALRGKNAISDKTMVTIAERSQGYLVQVRELSELPRSNPVDPTSFGRVVASVAVDGTGLRIEKLEARNGKGAVREDDVLSALTFLAATGRAPSDSWFMEINEAKEGTRVHLTRLPLMPGAHTSITVSTDRITVMPGA